MTAIDLTADTIDIRDIMERVEELETNRDTFNAVKESEGDNWAEHEPSDAEELATLTNLLDDLAGVGGDEQWRGDWYPLTLIHEDHFEDHARELAEDIGAVDRDATWPNNCIDWSAAADQLRYDYSEIDVEGTTYYYR